VVNEKLAIPSEAKKDIATQRVRRPDKRAGRIYVVVIWRTLQDLIGYPDILEWHGHYANTRIIELSKRLFDNAWTRKDRIIVNGKNEIGAGKLSPAIA
jgi:hypothetical protein